MDIYQIIEQTQEKMESIPVPNTGNLLSNYAYGSCHLFALALHLELGYQMEYLWDTGYYFEGGDEESMVLTHAYCVHPTKEDTYVDARGLLSKEVILHDYEYNRERFERISTEKLEAFFSTEFFESPETGELEAIRHYIRENVADYQ